MSTTREDIGWLVPIFGPERLLKLSETFRQRAAGAASSYCPWMATVGRKAKLRTLHAVPNAKGSVVVDHQYLEALAEHVEINPQQPLAFFKIDAKEMKIWRTPSEDIQAQFESAKSLLYTSLPDIGGVFDNLVDMIIPLEIEQREKRPISGLSSQLCLGAILLTTPVTDRPYWRAELAIDLAHELAHQVVFLYQRADSLVVSDAMVPVYSGILGRDRPSVMAIHGAAALAYMCLSAIGILGNDLASDAEAAFAKTALLESTKSLLDTLNSLKTECQFTEVGQMLFNDLELVSASCATAAERD